MAAELKIPITADVNDAVRGLQQVETQANATFRKVAQSSGQATTAVGNLSRIVQDAPFGFIGISNNLQPLFDNFTKLKSETGSVGGAFKSFAASLTGPAGIGLAFAAITTAITFVNTGFSSWIKKTKESKEATDEYTKSVNNAISSVSSEAAKISTLVEFIKLETTSKKERNNAIKELQSLAPGYFANLNAEKASISDITNAYDKYLFSLRKSIEARVIEKELQDTIAKRLELEKKLNLGRPIETAVKNGKVVVTAYNAIYDATGELDRATKELNQTKQKELDLSKQLAMLQPPKVKPADFKPPELDIPLRAIVEFNDKVIRAFENATKEIKKQLLQIGDATNTAYIKRVNEIIKKNPIELQFQPVDPNKIIEEKDARLRAQFLEQLFNNAVKEINKSIESIQIESLTSLGEGIGKALSGGGLKSVFQGFVDTIAGGVVAIGKQMIALGIKAALLKKALSSLFQNPVALIAAGVGLVAVGSAIKGALSRGIEGREKGGPVSGNTPYIVGERGPELFVPAVGGSIIPNNRLGAFNGRPAFAGAMGGRSIVRGSDIILSYARTQRSQNRVNG